MSQSLRTAGRLGRPVCTGANAGHPCRPGASPADGRQVRLDVEAFAGASDKPIFRQLIPASGPG